MNFSCAPVKLCLILIRPFEILGSDRLFASSLICLCKISAKAFQFSRVTSVFSHSYQFGSAFILIRSFQILQSDRHFASSLICLCKISAKAFHFSRVTSYPYQFGSAPNCWHETFSGSDPYRIIFKSAPVWVRIAYPNGFGSIWSRVNAGPIPLHFGYGSI